MNYLSRRQRSHSSLLYRVAWSWLAAVMGGCASNVPLSIRQAPDTHTTVSAAQVAPDRHVGAAVRWGGELVLVRNEATVSELEILGRRLASDGAPDPDSAAEGRFIARVNGFIDPADYKSGARVTVAGVLRGVTTGKVGEFQYRYPVVEVRQLYRWPKLPPASVYPDHYPWPYYGPWWPYRPYGYPYPWW